MKISFQIVVANRFIDREFGTGKSWPVADDSGKQNIIELEFEGKDNEDNLPVAEKLLDEYVKKNYPNKDYRIYYWWWK